MEVDLFDPPPPARLPDGYSWIAWSDDLLDEHADVQYRSFRDEIDAEVFANLGCPDGCQRLLREICRRPGFLPGATWLLGSPMGYCGTIQGVRERSGLGAIQNVGVLPGHRGLGLGEALVVQCLQGFYQAGLGRAFLEVTAHNDPAVRLYRRLGFRFRKTLYKAVEVEDHAAENAEELTYLL
jgi:GNAT superfamily N-acetyltransferase